MPIVSFIVQKLFSLIRSHLFIFSFNSITLGGGSQRILLWFMSESVLPPFSSRSFIVYGLTFTSLIHLEFIFVYGVRKCSSFILLQVVDQFSQRHLLKRLSFLHCIFLPPLSKIRCPSVLFSSAQLLSCVWLFVTLWIAACQASMSITNSRSLPKPVSIESEMPSSHLILCRPILLLPCRGPAPADPGYSKERRLGEGQGITA